MSFTLVSYFRLVQNMAMVLLHQNLVVERELYKKRNSQLLNIFFLFWNFVICLYCKCSQIGNHWAELFEMNKQLLILIYFFYLCLFKLIIFNTFIVLYIELIFNLSWGTNGRINRCWFECSKSNQFNWYSCIDLKTQSDGHFRDNWMCIHKR